MTKKFILKIHLNSQGENLDKVSTSVKVFFKVFLLSLNRVQKDRIGYPCQKFEQFEIFKMAAGGHLEFQLFSAKKLK